MTKSLSSSGVSSCYSEMDADHLNVEESDEEDAFISFTTTESKCERLYQEGLELKHQGYFENSLQAFLKCLEGMQECQYFVKLPQTLHQLSALSCSMHDFQRAKEYEKAEKLFYEATVVESSPQTQVKETVPKHKKRRPFSKKPKPTTSVCNPAEYGNILSKKADELVEQARVLAKENKFNDAIDHCSKAVCIRQCIFGKNHHLTVASIESLKALHTEANIYEASTDGVGDFCPPDMDTALLKGDLSIAEQVGHWNEKGSSQSSAECGGAGSSLLPTTSDNGSALNNNTTHLLPPKDFSTQTDFVLSLSGNCRITSMQEGAGGKRSLHLLYSNEASKKVTEDVDKASCRQECTFNSIHKDTRQDGANQVNGVQHQGKSQQEIGGVKSNLTKLSELKNPMCVNLDLHKGPGKDAENTRCLPLWILLLPAFLALVGYYTFYYH